MKAVHRARPGLAMLSLLLSLGLAACNYSETSVINPFDLGVDGGREDAAQLDAGPLDAGPLDAAQLDAGPLDAGPLDAGPLEDGQLEDGQLEDGQLEDGQVDDGQVDDGQLDDGQLDDGQFEDGQFEDGQLEDGQLADGQVADAQLADGQVDDGQLDAADSTEDGIADDGGLVDDAGPSDFSLRANGGQEAATQTFAGLDFVPLNDFAVSGAEVHNSDEALQGGYVIDGTSVPDLYRTETWLPVNSTTTTFVFPVDPGEYTVHLHFVDWSATMVAAGDRVFDVSLQGSEVLSDFDIISEVGKNTALVKSFDIVSTGQVELRITQQVGYPEIAAVEIVPRGQSYVGGVVLSPAETPTGLTASAQSSSTALVQWTDQGSSTSRFELQWRLSSDSVFGPSQLLGPDTTSYTVTGLQPATAYLFRVAAGNALGLSAWSEEVTATTQALAAVDCGAANILCVDDDSSPQQEYSSIQAAVDAATSGDTIYVRAGTYLESVTIDKDHLTLRAFPGEEHQAVISGAQAVTGWSLANAADLDGNPNAAHIYVANSPCGDVQRLFQGETELRASRFPGHAETGEERYLHISWVDSSNPLSHFSTDELSGLKPTGYFNDARAHVRTVQWRIGASRVSSFASSGDVVLSNNVSGYDMGVGWGFFFTQVVGEIGSNGEWALRNGQIYMMSAGTPSDVLASCKSTGIRVTASVSDVEIQGLRIVRFKDNGVGVDENTNQGVTIKENIIEESGRYGVDVLYGGGPTQVLNNDISGSWLGGIRFRQTASPLARGNHVHEICTSHYNDDVLTDGRYGQCTGILIINGAGGIISQNELENIGYIGIGVVDFGDAGDREITFNHVLNAMQGINDGGCIYFGVLDGHEDARDFVGNNIVEGCIGAYLGTTSNSGYYPQGVGIYLDDESAFIDVQDNTMVGNAINLYLHDAREDNIVDNIVFGGTRNNIFMTHQRASCSESAPNPRHNTLTGTISFSTSDTVLAMSLQKGYAACDILSASDNNAYFGAGAADYIKHRVLYPTSVEHYYDLAEWQSASGLDAQSEELGDCAGALIVTNPTLDSVTCTSLSACHDIHGVSVGSLSLGAFESTILCGCAATPQCN